MIIDTLPALTRLFARVATARTLYLDTETTGLRTYRGARICGVVISCDDDADVFYAPLRHFSDEPQIKPAVFMSGFEAALRQADQPQAVFHNAKFDCQMFLADGVDLRDLCELHDTEIQSHLVDEQRKRHALKLLARDVLGLTSAGDLQDYVKKEIARRGYDVDRFGYAQFGVAELAPYACNDVVIMRPLFNHFNRVIERENLHEVYLRERQVLSVVIEMEQTGIRLDRDAIRRAIVTLDEQIPGVHMALAAHAEAASVYTRAEAFLPRYHAAVAAWRAEHPAQEVQKLSRRTQKNGEIKETTRIVLEEPKLPPLEELLPDVPYVGRKILISGKLSSVEPGDPFQSPTTVNLIAQRLGLADAAEDLGILKSGKREGLNSWDKTVLKALASKHPFARDLLQYRFLKKLKGTYFEPYLELTTDDYPFVHPELNQIGTSTGRCSSRNPNFQNLLRPDEDRDDDIEVKQVIIPRPGYCFVGADYESMEMAMLAELTGEESIIDALREGKDLHAERARLLWPDYDDLCAGAPCEHEPHCTRTQKKQRQIAKVVNFAIVYGASPKKAGITAGAASEEEGKAIVAALLDSMPRVKAFRNWIYRELAIEQRQDWWKLGRYGGPQPTLRNLYGRVYHFPVHTLVEPRVVPRKVEGRYQEVTEYFYVQGAHAGLNYLDQGSCAEIVKEAMVKLWLRTRGTQAQLLLQVHDELVLEVLVAEAVYWGRVLKEVMEDTPMQRVRLGVDVWVAYESWAKKQALDLSEVCAA